jgi:multidrug efflux pump subunit AcrA (membrane-fusion protein)
VEIRIPNPKLRLRPGMFTRVSLVLGETETIVVPSIAVLQQEGTNFHYVFINDNGVARRENITIGQRFDENLEIISESIVAGDEIIVAGQASLMDNFKIEVYAEQQ